MTRQSKCYSQNKRVEKFSSKTSLSLHVKMSTDDSVAKTKLKTDAEMQCPRDY